MGYPWTNGRISGRSVACCSRCSRDNTLLVRIRQRIRSPAFWNVKPDWTSLRSDTPLPIRTLLQRCLRKDPGQRLSDIGEARILLDAAVATKAPAASSAAYVVRQIARHKLSAALTVCAVALIVGTGWWTIRRQSVTAPDIPSIAVLPFNTIGSGDSYLADGLTRR